ncbi:MAG: hypothetical protein KAR16_06225 [Bacteroidales bacterium]|nr:hypothetical protein [Bacteroidales bacterium]
MGQRRSYSYIYSIQRIILLVFYTTTSISLAIPLIRLVTKLSPNHFYPLMVTILLYVVVVVIVGALIHVVSYIPFNLANAFDPIKNDIASGRIGTMDQLGKRITEFTVQFFNFSFLDISHAYIQTDGSDIIGHDLNKQVEKVLKEYQMLHNSQELDGITRAGEISLPDGDYHLYILPIRFGNRWLGYMALLSRKKISHFFQRFLMEYENNFLDDQVMHLMQYQKR